MLSGKTSKSRTWGGVRRRSQGRRRMGSHQQPHNRSKTGLGHPPAPTTVPCPSSSSTCSCSPPSSAHSYAPPLCTSPAPSTSHDPPANFIQPALSIHHLPPCRPQPQPHGPTNSSSNPKPPATPWGIDPIDGRKWIYPDGDTFYPVVDVVREITEIIQSNFDRPCYNWGEADDEIKELWFKEWMKCYKWLPQHDLQIRKHWKFKAGKLLRGMMHNVRNNLPNKKPIWIPEDVLNTMITKWSSEDYQKKQEQAKKNRASKKGGSIHTGGSIPLSEHKRRMKKEIGRQPTLAELFVRTHKKRGTNEFIDKRSAEAYAEFNKLKTVRSFQASVIGLSGDIDENSKDTAIWVEAVGGKDKKGRIFGAGSEARALGSSSGKISTPHEPWLQKFEKELERSLSRAIENRDQALERQRKEIARQQAQLETYQQVLDRHDRMLKELLAQLNVPPIDEEGEELQEDTETGDDGDR